MTRDIPPVAIIEPGYACYDAEAEALAGSGAELVVIPEGADLQAALAHHAPQVVFVRETLIGADLMQASPKLRGIVRYGVGVDGIDRDAAKAARIVVANVPDYGAEHEVSDHAVALYLALNRRLFQRDALVRRGDWGNAQAMPVPGRRGATLGLIGFGKIARQVCSKFQALGFSRVLVCDPFVQDALLAEAGAERASLRDICASADVVSLHAPLTPDTRHAIGPAEIALFGPQTILLNVARGGLVDEAALAAALADGRLFGAGVDVFEAEPVAPDHPLLAAPNCILSDHNAWYSEQSVREIQSRAAREARRIVDGQRPENWVNAW